MKVLITGSSGYLGRLIAEELLRKKIAVVGVDVVERVPPAGDLFTYYRCCVTEKERLAEIFTHEQPTHVLHFACSFNKVRNRQKEYDQDVAGSLHILEAANQTPSVRQLVHASSSAAYGGHRDNRLWLKETDPLRPGKYRYAVNKMRIEQALCGTTHRAGLKIACLRICTVVGPTYRKPHSVVSLLIKSRYLPLFCRNNLLQFVHSADLTDLLCRILDDNDFEGIYNLASDSVARVREIAPDLKFVWIPKWLVKGMLWVFWNLKLVNFQPAGFRDALYPIIIDPAKILTRFRYHFRYSSREAFLSTRTTNLIPADSLF